MSDIRVFISVEIPDKSCLDAPLSELKAFNGVRTSPPEQIHITLRFIGDVDESKVDRIEDCVRRAAEGTEPFEVTVAGTGAFPNRGRPSVVWIGASPEKPLAGLADRIGANLKKAGIPFDSKPFKSHVTIGRCREKVDLDGFFDEFSDREFSRFTCSEILVMKSVLGPRGARHTVLRRVPLQ